ncbi:hypothetical protein ZWY2020_012826 [Hordeum vulgare]|nr:hypothetical protein ZWY2020_012826 [Hordeum vulgare]
MPPSSSKDALFPETRRRTDKQGRRLEVYNEVLACLRAAEGAEISPAFQDALWAHFHRLPARYALDVNAERAEDVVTHQRLLEEARDPQRRPALSVRVVEVSRIIDDMDDSFDPEVEILASNNLPSQMVHPPPRFSSSSNLEAPALEANESDGTKQLQEKMIEKFRSVETGSGKTHTMLGEISELGVKPGSECDMAPRIFQFLIARIRAEEESRRDENLKYNCKCSFLEIYNEQITDLLDPSSTNLQAQGSIDPSDYTTASSLPEPHSDRFRLPHASNPADSRRISAISGQHDSRGQAASWPAAMVFPARHGQPPSRTSSMRREASDIRKASSSSPRCPTLPAPLSLLWRSGPEVGDAAKHG